MKEYLNSTVGMMVSHENTSGSFTSGSCLVRVQFYAIEGDKVLLVPVSGHSLRVIRGVKQRTITREEYANRPYDYADDQVEFRWAAGLLGFE